jgi:DNA-directed RNA polymerase alpha subunit
MTDYQRRHILAVDDETSYLYVKKNLKFRRKTLILRIGSFGDTGESKEIEVTEWDLISLLKQLDVGSGDFFFERLFDDETLREILLDVPIKAFDFSIRTSNFLDYAGIDTIRKLVEKTARELKNIRSFGNKSLNEIQELLDKLGFALRSDPDA